MERVPYARIDFEADNGVVGGKLALTPYAAIFQSADAEAPSIVTDYFVPQAQLLSELQKLAQLPPGTEITPRVVEAIGYGCEEIGGFSTARLKGVSPVVLAGPRLAETALLRRGLRD
jgi:hypothetical protein